MFLQIFFPQLLNARARW